MDSKDVVLIVEKMLNRLKDIFAERGEALAVAESVAADKSGSLRHRTDQPSLVQYYYVIK